MKEEYIQPPIGLIPRKIANERRMKEIIEAVQRYQEALVEVPVKWIEEYNDLIKINKDLKI